MSTISLFEEINHNQSDITGHTIIKIIIIKKADNYCNKKWKYEEIWSKKSLQ